MSYATQQDLVDRYGLDEIVQLTDRTGTGQVDATVVARALADADAIIDAYVGLVTTLPLSSVPPRLSQAACVIARYSLWQDGHPDRVRLDYEDAIAWLRDIAAGRASLGLAPSVAPAPSTAPPAARAPARWPAGAL